MESSVQYRIGVQAVRYYYYELRGLGYGGLVILLLWLLLDPVGSSPVGGEPYSWRRPVPGWRQSEESVTLENQGFHFEPAEFEAHFRDQGMLKSCLYAIVDQ